LADLGRVIRLLHGARERYSSLVFDAEIRVDPDHFGDMDVARKRIGIRLATVTMLIERPWRWRGRWDRWDGAN
jgi:hypothetical protein